MPTRRVFVSGLFHETHTFLEGTTTWHDFRTLEGQELLGLSGDSSPMGGALERAASYGWTIVPGLISSASPGAIVEDDAFCEYWSRFRRALQAAQADGPLDAVFLVLHGAMTCQSLPDVEGEFLRRLSKLLSNESLPVFGVYDLHANFTQLMAQHSHCLVAYRQNPHADARESAVRAVDLLARCLETKTLPRTFLEHPPVMWPPTGTGSADDPMKSLLALARELQARNNSIWEINVNAGFSFADIPETGVSFTVVAADGEQVASDIARPALEQLSQRCLELALVGNRVEPTADEVLSGLPTTANGLTVLVEPSDNIGGGAPGDCTGLLRAMLKYRLQNSAACLCDPEAVAALESVSPGSQIELALGGKGSRLDPGPIRLKVTLIRRFEGLFELADKQSHLASMVGDRFDMGPSAVVEAEGITILLTSIKTPPMDLGQWKHAGFDPGQFRYVAVKAAVAHRKAWDPISQGNLWVSTPGPCSSRLNEFPFTQINRPIFPLDSLATCRTRGWYVVENADRIASPALLVYPDRILSNLKRMIELAGGVDRLRPHVKTHKLPQIVALKRSVGITRFKTATIAEAELVAAAGGEDVMLAIQPVGPAIDRFIRLLRTYPATRFSTIVDDAGNLLELSRRADAAGVKIHLYVDINVGMNRTGTDPTTAERLYRMLSELPGVSAAGLHAYDGHLHNTDLSVLQESVTNAFAGVWQLRDRLEQSGLRIPKIIASGTPTFKLLATVPNVEVGCGTTVLWDFGQAAVCPDLNFQHAALLLTRVISKPTADRLCFDLGHKAVASEMVQPRVQLLGLEDAAIVVHSEEHLVVQTSRASDYNVGDVVYAIPRHICPTMALHQEVHVVRNHRVEEQWPVIGRARRITI